VSKTYKPVNPYLAIFSSVALLLQLGLPAYATMKADSREGDSPVFPIDTTTESQDGKEKETGTILAQMSPPASGQNPDVLVPNPQILIDGNPTSPGGSFSAPMPLPRAVAPPVGDISISNIDASPDLVQLGSSVIVPRLVLREAPVREVLALLARAAGTNLVFADVSGEEKEKQDAQLNTTISLDLENESVQEAFNSVLVMSGLNAHRKGNLIFVGARLPAAARNLISRTLRLNQVEAPNAAAFLAGQGASVQQLITPIIEVVDPETQRIVRREAQPPTLQALSVEEEEGSNAPLLLRDLKVSTDDRLNSVTLIGEPRKVEMATSFLTQLDARRRQAAINVKIVDVNLNNLEDYSASFSFQVNDTYVVQDNGSAVVNFGGTRPPNTATDLGRYFPPIVPLQTGIAGSGDIEFTPFVDVQRAPYGNVSTGTILGSPFPAIGARPNFGTYSNPFQAGITEIDEEGKITYEIPQLFKYPDQFLLQLQAQIQNRNAKILTDPTLIVQEGQEATVQLTQNVLTSVDTEVDVESGVRTTTPVFEPAGLVLTVNIDRIDDNGFITLSTSPSVSAPGPAVTFDSGLGTTNTFTPLNTRKLSSGLIRLRDGQTLILSGIIQETDRTTVSKVPILGDLPLLGSLFRSTNKENDRKEVIILLTPQILNDSQGANFGYSYTPGREAGDFLRDRGLNIPSNR
jgi:type IV pilus assembly protein PilQ